MQKINSKTKGYVTLITVLVMGAISVSVTMTIVMTGIISTKDSLSVVQSRQANFLANACAEDALQEIRNDTLYVGTVQINLGSGSCTYTVTNNGGESRTIASSGTVGTIIRKSKIQIDAINPKINITSWQEVADF